MLKNSLSYGMAFVPKIRVSTLICEGLVLLQGFTLNKRCGHKIS